MDEVVIIIPARGGSKRIPGKNIRDFRGKPIIAYSIEAAKKSGLGKVIVSTDSKEIATISTNYGADYIIDRPEYLSRDDVGTAEVIINALEEVKAEYICCLYPTVPMIRVKDIVYGYELVKDNKCDCDSCFPVVEMECIWRALNIKEDGFIHSIWPSPYRSSNSQDLPIAYQDAGQFYWSTAESLLCYKDFISNSTIPIILPKYLVQDINTFEDWERAEIMYEILERKGLLG